MARPLLFASLVCWQAAMAADPADEVRRTEIAFAKAFAERDQAAFFTFVLDDASFLSSARTLAGKPQVFERWSKFFAGPKAPFSWGPERIAVNAAGTIGLSTGPVFDAAGKHAGNFSSVWVKQANGSWKVLFDGPGSPAACLAGVASAVEDGFVVADDGVKLRFRKVGNGPFTLIVPLELLAFDDVEQLADIATVIAYEPRGRGSERVADAPAAAIHQDVKDMEAVRKHFGVERFVPVGTSSLGLVAALYAMEHPERVARLVQVGPTPMKAAVTKADLAKLTLPALTIHGKKDGNAPYEGGREWALSLPNARLVTLDGAAGKPWVDDPVGVFGSIREFLRGGWPLGAEKVTRPEPRS